MRRDESPSDRQRVGRMGERLAEDHLHRLGWEVLDRNWRCRSGEIDLVALDPHETGTIVFVEVKCRTGSGYGSPLEAITQAKLRRLCDLAVLWLRAHDMHAPHIRIDGIGVSAERGRLAQLTHVRGLTS